MVDTNISLGAEYSLGYPYSRNKTISSFFQIRRELKSLIQNLDLDLDLGS